MQKKIAMRLEAKLSKCEANRARAKAIWRNRSPISAFLALISCHFHGIGNPLLYMIAIYHNIFHPLRGDVIIAKYLTEKCSIDW